MFRTVMIGAGLVLAPGRFGTADAARSRTRTPANAEPPRASTTRLTRRIEARCPPPHGVIGRAPWRRPGPPALPTLPRR